MAQLVFKISHHHLTPQIHQLGRLNTVLVCSIHRAIQLQQGRKKELQKKQKGIAKKQKSCVKKYFKITKSALFSQIKPTTKID